MIGKYTALFLLAIAWLPAASAEEIHVTRNEAIAIAYRNNPELRIAVLEIARAESRLRWSGRLENPELELSANDDFAGLDENEGTFEIAFSQKFPLTSRLRDEKRLRGHQVVLADAEIAEQRRQLAYRVDLALIDLQVAQEKVRLEQELVALNADITKFLQEGADRGEVSALDVTQAKLNGSTLRQQVRLLETMEKQKSLQFKKVVGIEPFSTVFVDGVEILPGDLPGAGATSAEILSRRPDYVLALARIDEAEAAVALENARKWEDVTFKVFAERERAVDEPTGLERNSLLGVGISIPLPLRKRNQDGIEQAEIDRESAERGVEAVQFQIRSEYTEAVQMRADSWGLAFESTGEVLDLAQKNLEDFRKAQAQGQASLLQVQRAQEQVLELKTASLDAREAYLKAEAHLRFVTGDYPGLSTGRSKK